jgi:hypothetical protein
MASDERFTKPNDQRDDDLPPESVEVIMIPPSDPVMDKGISDFVRIITRSLGKIIGKS